MTPGTFFFDSQFKFHDGEDGQKIFITIGSDRGITLVVKTTSKGKRYLNDFGCQSDHRFQNFHLVKNCCCLSKPTWIDLGEFYEFNDTDLLQKHFSGQVSRIGTLTDELTIDLMKCSIKSYDISSRQIAIVQASMNITTLQK